MSRLSRRSLLGTVALAALGLPCRPEAAVVGPPVAPIRPVTDVYDGIKVTDPYRWMESEDADWERYVKAQGAYTAQILGRIPGRAALAAAIGRDDGAAVDVIAVQTGWRNIFTQRRPAGANTSKLFVRDTLAGTDRLLIDPDRDATATTHAALDWWSASPDSSHVVFGISQGGSEQSVMHVLRTDTGARGPEAIDRTYFANPNWLPDGSGYFYNRLQAASPDSVQFEQDSACWLHKVGTDGAGDIKVMAKGLSPKVAARDNDIPFILCTPGSDLAIGCLDTGVQNEVALFVARLAEAAAGGPVWTKICAPADGVTAAAQRGDDIYLLTHDRAPRYRVVKVTGDKPAFADAVELVPPSDAVIRGIAAARDALYILDLKAGIGGIRRLAPDGTITRIALPFKGAIDQTSFYADTLHDGVWFLIQSWVIPTIVCHAGPDGQVTPTDLAPKPAIALSPYMSEEVMVTARDGVHVPLSIIYRKGTRRDGQAPLVLEAYGAYGTSLDPNFLARWLPWLDLGGVFAVAHVRGGGELGEDWHQAGLKLTKYHSWQDMIDCGQYLIDQGWTSHRRLAVFGRSAGGITVGRLLTERPDLAAVVICQVGITGALRFEVSPNGPLNIPEFGTVKTPAGFKGLYAMDAYQHVREGVNYPSILLTTGLHDPRVAGWEPTKMTARLQAATASNNPVLLRVEADAGHGIGSTRRQRDGETADIMAFILWRTGDARYQPKTRHA